MKNMVRIASACCVLSGVLAESGAQAQVQARLVEFTVGTWEGGNGGINVAPGEVDRILNQASALLQQSCSIVFGRLGALRKFSSPASGALRQRGDMEALLAQPGYLKLVNSITSCGDKTGSFAGCAPTPGNTFAIPVSDFLDLAWGPSAVVHEFGHTLGLQHATDAVSYMFPFLPAPIAGHSLLKSECNTFLNKPFDGNGPRGAMPAVMPQMTPVELPALPIAQLAHTPITDEMPFHAVGHYGREDAAELRAMLADPREASAHRSIALLLGIISDGDDRDALSLVDYADDARLHGNPEAALIALGYAANRGSTRALDYLADTLEEEVGANASVAIQALGVSGRPEASGLLAQISARRASAAPAVYGLAEDGVDALIAQALADHEVVSSIGLDGYYAR